MKLQGRVAGLDKLGGALADIAGGEAVARALREAAEDIRRRAAANLADGLPPGGRTGALAQSLTVTPEADGRGYIVSTALDHGWQREAGSRARPPAPWLAPAAEDARPGALAHLRGGLNASIAGALRRWR